MSKSEADQLREDLRRYVTAGMATIRKALHKYAGSTGQITVPADAPEWAHCAQSAYLTSLLVLAELDGAPADACRLAHRMSYVVAVCADLEPRITGQILKQQQHPQDALAERRDKVRREFAELMQAGRKPTWIYVHLAKQHKVSEATIRNDLQDADRT